MKRNKNKDSISEDQSGYNKTNQSKIFHLDWLYEDLTKGYSNTKVPKLTKIKKLKKSV